MSPHDATKPGAPACVRMTSPAAHNWHPSDEPGVWLCAHCGIMFAGDPHAYTTPAPEYPRTLADIDRRTRQQERERCAAILRAYAETRPAGEAYALLRLCATMEAP